MTRRKYDPFGERYRPQKECARCHHGKDAHSRGPKRNGVRRWTHCKAMLVFEMCSCAAYEEARP